MVKARETGTSLPTTHHDRPRASSPINDNYCLNVLKAGLLAGSKKTKPLSVTRVSQCDHSDTTEFKCKLACCKFCNIAEGHLQKKDVSPDVVNCYQRELKYMKGVSCVNHLFFVKPFKSSK